VRGNVPCEKEESRLRIRNGELKEKPEGCCPDPVDRLLFDWQVLLVAAEYTQQSFLETAQYCSFQTQKRPPTLPTSAQIPIRKRIMCVCPHNVRMSQKRTKADKAQREADLLDKRSSHRPPQKQGKKPREDFNQAAVRIVEEAAEKH
jgi:hypothetical protein